MPYPALADCVTLADIALRLGSYFTAHSLAAAGRFGPPIAVVGRSKLFSARAVDAAIAERAKRKSPTRAA
jgi:hypothetical protein